MVTLEQAKLTLRLVTDGFDDEISGLIAAAYANLTTRGVTVEGDSPLIQRAVLTYVRMNFGQPDDYDRLKASYDEQLGQLMTTTGYTRW